MSAKTEPKTHSPAAAAGYWPAEAPEPIVVLVSGLSVRSESFLAGSGSQKRGDVWSLLGDSYNKPRPATAAESKTRPAKPKQ